MQSRPRAGGNVFFPTGKFNDPQTSINVTGTSAHDVILGSQVPSPPLDLDGEATLRAARRSGERGGALHDGEGGAVKAGRAR